LRKLNLMLRPKIMEVRGGGRRRGVEDGERIARKSLENLAAGEEETKTGQRLKGVRDKFVGIKKKESSAKKKVSRGWQ